VRINGQRDTRYWHHLCHDDDLRDDNSVGACPLEPGGGHIGNTLKQSRQGRRVSTTEVRRNRKVNIKLDSVCCGSQTPVLPAQIRRQGISRLVTETGILHEPERGKRLPSL
jgi:hypothetical protein